MRQKTVLTASDADAILAAAKAEAVRSGWAVSIAVVDDGGFLLRLDRLDGASLKSPDIAFQKAQGAAYTRMPTKTAEDAAKERPGTMFLPRIPVQGGLPIMVGGECVGAVGVSGVKSHEDEAVAAAGIAALGL